MKRGSAWTIVLIIVGVLLLIGVAGAYYAYNVHVYKTVRICLGEDIDSGFPCKNTQQCMDLIETYSNKSVEIKEILNNAPTFLKEKFQEGLDKAVRCENTCILRNMRGINAETKEFEFLDSCNANEEEIALEIRGKEALEIRDFLKDLERDKA